MIHSRVLPRVATNQFLPGWCYGAVFVPSMPCVGRKFTIDCVLILISAYD
jgi:hypothetical protein